MNNQQTQPSTKNIVASNWKKWLLIFWGYTLLVILWGAWVRISHSGNGCGDHWPLCAGEVIPDFVEQKTIVEYLHRLMSGSYGLMVLFIFFKLKNHPLKQVKLCNWGLLLLTISEALLGALLVKLELVHLNDSYLRLFYMSLHQLNSFALAGVTILLAFSLTHQIKWSFIKKWAPYFLIVGVTGAIAALSTTLFPTISLWDGILKDFQSDSHPFIKLRILHPLLAILIMTGLMSYFYQKNKTQLALEILLAMLVGVITLVTLSPLPLKVAHLAIAHYLWARYLYELVIKD